MAPTSRSFGADLARTLRDPLAWLGGVSVALVGAEQPGDWIAHALARAIRGPDAHGALNAPTLLDALDTSDAGTMCLRWLALATLGWIVRLPLVAASLTASRGDGKESASSLLLRGAARVFRTRGTGIMVTAACAAIPAYALVAWRQSTQHELAADLGLALLLGLAGGWLALADRFAFVRFDAPRDAIARRAIEDAWNAPHYLDTGSPRGGYGVADGTDSAVSSAGSALFQRHAFAVVALGALLDTLRALGTSYAPVGLGSSAARVALGALASIVVAVAWTRAFLLGPTDRPR